MYLNETNRRNITKCMNGSNCCCGANLQIPMDVKLLIPDQTEDIKHV